MLPVKTKYALFSFIFTIFIIVFLGINISNVYAVTFIDHSGFMPNWASNIGQSQTLSICSTSIQPGTNDFKWCSEFSGYTLDQLSATSGNISQQSAIPEFGSTYGVIITVSMISIITVSRKFPI